MIRALGIYPDRRLRSASTLAAATFAVGLLIGGAVGALTAGERAAPASAPAPSVPPVRAISYAGHPAEVLRVIDGDTFEARVQVWPGIAITTKVRLRGIDAPELRARCRDELTKAEAAREALKAIMAQGAVGISRIGLDKYGGRVVAYASTSHTPDVSQALLTTGLVRPYAGGRRESWCGRF